MRRAKALCLGFPRCPVLCSEGPSWKQWTPDSINIWISLRLAVLGHNGHAVDTDQLSRCWFIGSSQVEQVVGVGARPPFAHQVVVLSLADHLAAVRDCLHIVLVFMAWLIQGILEEENGSELETFHLWLLTSCIKNCSDKNSMRLLAISLVQFEFPCKQTTVSIWHSLFQKKFWTGSMFSKKVKVELSWEMGIKRSKVVQCHAPSL